jgi:serine/threonine-protein kinase RsbW
MTADRIELTVPARGGFARTVRVTAAALAGRMGMSIDEVDDVRIALEEAFLFAVDRVAPGQPITFVFSVTDETMDVTVGPLACEREVSDEDETGSRYASFILEAVCDEFELVTEADSCMAHLVKHTGERP